MRLLDVLSSKKAEKKLENEYYCIIDTWMSVEDLAKKGLISSADVKGVISTVCKDARKKLEEIKQTDIEVYNKYSQKFERCFAQMTAYAKSVSTDLRV